MSPDKLVYMATNGKFFRNEGDDAVVKKTAEHLRKFWDPRMREAIIAHLDAGDAGLDLPVRRAIEQLKDAASRN